MSTKTTVYLPDDIKAGITREARRRGVAEAVVIRDALAAALDRPRPTAGLFAAAPFADRAQELLDGFGEP
jgi:predicted transcriptional regulator